MIQLKFTVLIISSFLLFDVLAFISLNRPMVRRLIKSNVNKNNGHLAMSSTNKASKNIKKFRSQEETIQELSNYYKKLLSSESFGYKLSSYYFDPQNVTLNYGPTSIMDSPAETLSLGTYPHCHFYNTSNMLLLNQYI